MTAELTIALVQQASTTDPEHNRAALSALVPADADLVVLPEAFARDFGPPGSSLGAAAEALTGPFATEVERLAGGRETTIAVGMFESSHDPERPWNTVIVRGAARVDYRKIHLYDSFGYRESDVVSAGPIEPTVVMLGSFRIGVLTCYDLRFPEMARWLVAAGAEVLVIPAAWVSGERKVDHWRTLLRARAIENTAYVVGVGQPGPRYSGHSMVVDPLGDVLVEAGEAPDLVTAVITRERLDAARRDNPSLANRRLNCDPARDAG